MPTAVIGADVAIGLARGGVFTLLARLHHPLYVPGAVVQEVVTDGQGRPRAAELVGLE